MVDFPDVPDVPGVPDLLRDPSVIDAGLSLLDSDSVGGFGDSDAPQWGLFLNGQPVVLADTVVSFGYRKESDISTYPQERGAFQSYNKVQHPYDVRLRFARGGSLADRQEFLNSLAAIEDTLDLYDAVTPERVYPNVNVIHDDYRRSANSGPGMISVDVGLQEVRDAGQSQFSSTSNLDTANIVDPKSPSAGAESSGGTVQPEVVGISIKPTPAGFQ